MVGDEVISDGRVMVIKAIQYDFVHKTGVRIQFEDGGVLVADYDEMIELS